MHASPSSSLAKLALLAVSWTVVCGAAAATPAHEFSASPRDHAVTTVISIDMRPAIDNVSNPVRLAVIAASGLDNRMAGVATVYTLSDDYDQLWQSELLSSGNFTIKPVDPLSYLAAAFQTYGAILYDTDPARSLNYSLLPSIVTMAAVLDAVPMDESLLAMFPSTKVVLDTRSLWSTAEAAVQYAQQHALAQASSLAMQDGNLIASGLLVDWIMSERLFTMYLPQSCVPLTADHSIMKAVVAASTWPRPVRVYGYNSMIRAFGGDLFEAETNCIDVLGQVASANTNNLAFWSRLHPFTPGQQELIQPTPLPIVYESTRSYVALVYGDMDNIDFVRSFGSDHMRERVSRCSANQSSCFPLTWTLSPNLVHIAPDWMRWYYAMTRSTGLNLDWFIMPPCGTLYSYPSEMPLDVQALYSQQQNDQAYVMNTTGSVHWEWFYNWRQAWSNYFPRYTAANSTSSEPTVTRAFFLNNVPWVLPILDMFLHGETYRWVGDPADPGSVVGFKPAFNWQEGSPGGGEPYNASVIAAQIGKLPLGSVQYIYVIQNTNMSSVFEMVSMLPSHVQLVSYEQLVDLARQREAAGSADKAAVAASKHLNQVQLEDAAGATPNVAISTV